MSGIHIDDFYADATHILVSLHSVFPRPVTIFAEDICGTDEPDEYGVHSHRYQACFAAMVWLADEGFIRYTDTIRQDAVDQAVLTGKCFAALISPIDDTSEHHADNEQALPPSIKAQHATLIFRLQQALKSRSSTAIETTFTSLLQTMR
jgi:hypothetical protein